MFESRAFYVCALQQIGLLFAKTLHRPGSYKVADSIRLLAITLLSGWIDSKAELPPRADLS